ncbi:hypothetical protein [Porphyromonas gulae]|uniref:Lipoprotein n=1 Tax=Porphyromonas gulae TaxID=111105 RepID=A0A0A2F2E1_9PORP|nr:hypothetical protein [Porphyromonas gulae]KGN85191.1 hypothetical protein HR08_06310 [Porphyromonas gulae]
MKREIITIEENGNVYVPMTSVWMSACEIAALFGVFSGKVNSHIKSIFKEGLLREDEVMQTLSFKGGAVDLYNVEMITMLSFRFASPQAKSFRKWIIGRVTEKKSIPPLLVCYTKGMWRN